MTTPSVLPGIKLFDLTGRVAVVTGASGCQARGHRLPEPFLS